MRARDALSSARVSALAIAVATRSAKSQMRSSVPARHRLGSHRTDDQRAPRLAVDGDRRARTRAQPEPAHPGGDGARRRPRSRRSGRASPVSRTRRGDAVAVERKSFAHRRVSPARAIVRGQHDALVVGFEADERDVFDAEPARQFGRPPPDTPRRVRRPGHQGRHPAQRGLLLGQGSRPRGGAARPRRRAAGPGRPARWPAAPAAGTRTARAPAVAVSRWKYR